MNYDSMIAAAKSIGELRQIEAEVARDRALDDVAKQGYITYCGERRMYDFGDLMGC